MFFQVKFELSKEVKFDLFCVFGYFFLNCVGLILCVFFFIMEGGLYFIWRQEFRGFQLVGIGICSVIVIWMLFIYGLEVEQILGIQIRGVKMQQLFSIAFDCFVSILGSSVVGFWNEVVTVLQRVYIYFFRVVRWIGQWRVVGIVGFMCVFNLF